MGGESHTRPGAQEDALLRRLLARDEAAFLEFVEQHHAGLTRVASTFVQTSSAADEVVQETWSAFLEGLATFEGRASLKTFLYRILANLARTRGTRDRRSTVLSELEEDGGELLADRFGTTGRWLSPPTPWGAETAEGLLERKQTMQELQRALDALPPSQRAVVQLRDVEGLPADEVCQLLGLSEVHQRVLLHRGRTRLRLALEGLFR